MPIAAGLIIGIGDTALKFSDTFSLSGIALGTIVVIGMYHLCQDIGSKNPELNAKNPEPNKPDSKAPGGEREEPAPQLT